MERAVVFAGFGGQGLLFAGQIVARAAVRQGLEAFWIPSYGPEMRGGTAACTVIVGDDQIGSPVVDRFDAVVAMNPPSVAKYGARVADGGLLIVNASLVDATTVQDGRGVTVVALPCTELAAGAGDDKLVSVVALGALVERLGLLSAGAIRDTIREVVGAKRPDIVDADIGAFEAGRSAAACAVAA